MSVMDRAEAIRGNGTGESGTERFVVVGLTGPASGTEIVFEKNTLVIGRSEECDLCLADMKVSRRHAKLTLVPDPVRAGHTYVLLEDLGSRNGVRVDGRVIQSTLLDGRERLTIGGSVLRVVPRGVPALP